MNEAAAKAKLYLASKNPGKLREFHLAIKEQGITVELVPGIQHLPACIEDGDTFEANARKKALHYGAFVDGWVFADDSGICVDALGGAPGVHSARYAGLEATDEENNQKLIRELARVSEAASSPQALHASIGDSDSRRYPARYVCVIALAENQAVRAVTEGQVSGLVINSPRGLAGFGYDPYFFYPPLGRTFAEISAEAKFAVSHRGVAFRKLLEALASKRI
ncbi:MAG: non-canonical purine NTP pyrophosphatase [Terriglobia bacterium]